MDSSMMKIGGAQLIDKLYWPSLTALAGIAIESFVDDVDCISAFMVSVASAFRVL